MAAISEIGNKYGRLTVLERVANNKYRAAMFLCVCDCGNTIVTKGASLRNGETKSCGCLQRDMARENIVAYNNSDSYVKPNNYKHGMRDTRLYKEWCNIKKRCYNPKYDHYDRYGGRGICVCDEWKSDFMNFATWAISSGYNDDLTIDRIDNDGNYSPDNCRWTTIKEQVRNRSNTIRLTHNGVKMSLAEWCEMFNVNYKYAHAKYIKGYSFEEIFNPHADGQKAN